MDISNDIRSTVLVEALPYMRKYNNKIIVVKYGGNAMIDENLKLDVMRDIVLLHHMGIKIVLVHGGGPEISGMLKAVGKESKFIDGLRYTDEETMEIVQMVLCGKLNKNLVALLQNNGGKAIGISGIDGGILTAQKYQGENDLGLVGDITKVDTDLIVSSIESGYIPVISTVAMDEQSNSYNINADVAASKIASALGAANFILMTDVKGLLRDVNDENSLMPEVYLHEVPQLKKEGVISGGMIPKIECCVDAVRRGVQNSCIIDGRVPHSLLIEMLTNQGIGTMFLK